MTPDQLRRIMPQSGPQADLFAQPLTDAMAEFDINTPRRQAAFLAQIAHESGQLRWVREIASGAAYEGRADLGNTQPGDGVKYKGRGLLQITGRANYRECGKALSLDLIGYPELLESAVNASRSAAWFWASRSLNTLADSNRFGAISKRINGGFNGLDERLQYWIDAREVLNA
jgi:putative chitinase